MKLLTRIMLLFFAMILLAPSPISAQEPPPVLAFYYAWFDQNTWESGQSVDLPAGRYNSADPATIERQVAQARGAGIDALVQSWYGPQVENNQTETNFRILLDKTQAQGMQAGINFETTSPFLADSGAVSNALSTLITTHARHPAYLRFQGKPVIFFWRQQRFSVEEWAAIRNQIDPDHNTIWIAEGVDISYQSVFDGHHLYSIAWAASPAGQLAKWGDRVRAYESENGVERLWVATAMPGYNDTNLPRADAFAVARRNGDYYRETWQGAVASQPDMIIITSFNEWPEGTHIEPSQSYGNLYLDVTRELATNLKGSLPPAVIPAAQELPPEESAADELAVPPAQPDGPYFETTGVTNVRGGPSTAVDAVGKLPAGRQIPVIGKLELEAWWQIEFAEGPDGKAWVAAEAVDFFGDAATVPVVEAPPVPKNTPIAEQADEAAPETGELPEATATPVENPPTVTVPDGGVNVRSGPGLDFELVGRLTAGESLPVTSKDESGSWWQVEFKEGENGLAWVAMAVVDFSGDADSVPVAVGIASVGPTLTPTSSPTPEPVIAGSVEGLDAINVRAEPSTGGEVIGGFYLGEKADVLSVSRDGEWWQIDFAGAPGRQAWVAAEFVRFSGDKEQVPVFGVPTATPTSAATNTPIPTSTPEAEAAEIPVEQPTLAPTATSIYDATSAAMLAEVGTPDPSLEGGASALSPFGWSDIPWGILAILVIAGFLWYQFIYRRGRRRR